MKSFDHIAQLPFYFDGIETAGWLTSRFNVFEIPGITVRALLAIKAATAYGKSAMGTLAFRLPFFAPIALGSFVFCSCIGWILEFHVLDKIHPIAMTEASTSQSFIDLAGRKRTVKMLK
ncbi:hypothetical protein P4H32_29330 [Bacillus cereus]|nr:hypothetical protein [Bacillus cereus]